MKITKKGFLITTLLLTIVFLILVFLGTRMCLHDEFCRAARKLILDDKLFFTVLAPISLFFSLLTFPMANSVFESWKRFAVWVVPTVAILTYLLIARDEATSGGFFDYNITGWILGIIYGIFVIISLVIIIKSWLRARRTKK